MQEKSKQSIKVYDPPMCCSTGVCGTNVDSKLVEFANALKVLSNIGIVVERFNMAQSPKAFADNVEVKKLLVEKGQNVLPLIFINDDLKWSGKIPSTEEIMKAFEIVYSPKAKDTCGCGCKSKCS